MAVEDKLKITIRVADIPEFQMSVKRENEEYYRAAIAEYNRLWSKWKSANPSNDTNRIILTIALSFARQYYEAVSKMRVREEQYASKQKDVEQTLDEFEKQLAKILLEM